MGKRRSGYDTYVAYYKKYAASGAMKEEMHSERGWAALKRDARKMGINTSNFSRTLAARQREASPIQLRITWAVTKGRLKEISEDLQKKRAEIGEKIQSERKKAGKRRYSARNLEKHVEKRLREQYNSEMEFFEKYKDITWKKFKFQSKELIRMAKTTVESRALWDEAFDYVYEDTKK